MIRKALVVGVNDYPDAPLSGCLNDAAAVGEVLRGPPYDYQVDELLGSNVTRPKLRRAISDLFAGADEAIFYFAGHGVSDDNGIYLGTFDGEPDDEGVGFDFLRKAVEMHGDKARFILLVLDCCHAGAASPRSKVSRAVTASRLADALPLIAEGRVLLASCRHDQLALETTSGEHGVFTTHLTAGLRGEAANRDGTITIHSLYDYLARAMNRERDQTPVFRGETMGSAVLASGFENGGLALSLMPTSEVLEACVRDARQHLDRFQIVSSSASIDNWKTSGYRAACDALEPIIEWFDRKLAQHPPLRRVVEFDQLRQVAIGRLQMLATMDPGTITRHGTVHEYLGGGTFGSVYKLLLSTGEHMAMKVYHPNDLRLDDKRARFERGYAAMKQLDHPHIVKVGELSRCPLAFVMSFIDGPNLRKFGGTLTDPVALVRVLLLVAETLQHAHNRGVVHRDVKPENILMQYTVDGDWVPYLTDFDLAWFSTATQVTKEAMGTVFYAAPEQLAKPASNAAHHSAVDAYAFGQLLFFVFTGSDPVPLGQANNRRALSERLDARLTRAAAESIVELYDKCTAIEPDERWSAFRKICDKLRKVLGELSKGQNGNVATTPQFIAELRYSLVGLDDSKEASFYSISRRTRVTLMPVEKKDDRLAIECSFVPEGVISFDGTSNESMRQTLNTRIDTALADYENVRRRSGKQGQYEAYVDIDRVRRTHSGVGVCAQVISRVIDALER